MPPIVFIQPKASSIRLRMRWLAPYPGWRVVRRSRADPRRRRATCGRTFIERSSFTKSDVSPGSSPRAGSPLVGPQRDGTRPIRMLLDHRQGGEALGVAVRLRQGRRRRRGHSGSPSVREQGRRAAPPCPRSSCTAWPGDRWWRRASRWSASRRGSPLRRCARPRTAAARLQALRRVRSPRRQPRLPIVASRCRRAYGVQPCT